MTIEALGRSHNLSLDILSGIADTRTIKRLNMPKSSKKLPDFDEVINIAIYCQKEIALESYIYVKKQMLKAYSEKVIENIF